MGDSEYGVTHNRLRIESQLNIIVRMTRSNAHVKICHLVGDSFYHNFQMSQRSRKYLPRQVRGIVLAGAVG